MVVIRKKTALLIALGVVTVVAVALATGFALSTMTGSRSYALPAKERAAWMRLIKSRQEKQDPDRAYVKLDHEFSVGELMLKSSSESIAASPGGLRDPARFSEAALFVSDPSYLYWVSAGQGSSSDRNAEMNGRVNDLVHDVHLAVLRQTRDSSDRRYALSVVAQITALDQIFTRCVAPTMRKEIQQLGSDLLGPAMIDADLVEGFWIGHEAARIHFSGSDCWKQ